MMSVNDQELSELVDGFNKSDRQALAKAITLVESTRTIDLALKEKLLARISKPEKMAIRMAISGPPGVGKSTFINALGAILLKQKYHVAILPIDPSSTVSKGSVLADKTRMKDLLSSDHVFIRPSPSRGALGGIALHTRDVMALVEAFGFDVVIIETVGVGQSEVMAESLADHFILLFQPGSGDQLQAMKMGILEYADFILVNKFDGEHRPLVEKTISSLNLLKTDAAEQGPMVFGISSITGHGLEGFFKELQKRHEQLIKNGALLKMRQEKSERFLGFSFHELLKSRIMELKWVRERYQDIIRQSTIDENHMSSMLNQLVEEICQRLEP